MRTIDLSPLYRSFIGSDHLAQMIDAASRNEKQSSYPPYNIELLGEDKYQITMAVAGFSQQDVSIEVQENTLTVSGKRKSEENDARKFLHKVFLKGTSNSSFSLATM